MSEQQRVYVNFTSDDFDKISSDLFQVVGFDGVEAISELFRFEMDLLSTDPDIDLASLVGKNASLEISKDGEQRDFHGVIASLEQGAEAQFDHYCYKAVLVPRMWLMSLSKQNQIYQEKTVPEIVQEEILHGDFCGGILADDIDNRMAETYPVREYTVQYRESDMDFMSRLMENEGIYYYFEHVDGHDKLVFCDQNSKLDEVLDDNIVSYVPKSGLASFDEQAIHSFKVKQVQVCKEIVLKDYNYREPHLPMLGTAETGDLGYGRKYAYGDHFKSTKEGNNLAHLRAQLELCKQKTCVGSSDALFFQAGKLIQVEDHYRTSLNREYLVTRIRHMGGQALPGVSALGSGEAVDYQNEFDAIPSDIEFRPSLVTPKPKLYGFMSAIVDGALSSDRAQIDEHGRYKLIMPFDVSGSGDGKASRWVRKAEPFGGQGTGMSFPLLKGAEVIWSCMDGDLDRPIITGVVPGTGEGANKSVVTAQNSTDNVIKTPSGIIMQMRDGKGAAPPEEEEEGTEKPLTRIPDEASVGSSASSHYMASNDNAAPLIQQQQHVAKTITEDYTVITGEAFSHNFATNFKNATAFTISSAPQGMEISNTGVLTWPAAVVGTHNFTVGYTQGTPKTKIFSIYVDALFFTAFPSNVEIESGTNFSFDVKTNSDAAITYTVTGITPTTAINANTGKLSWTAMTGGPYTVSVTATITGTTNSITQTFVITVTADEKFTDTRDVTDTSSTASDETQKSYSVYLPEYRMNTATTPALQHSYSRIGSYYADESGLFGNVYYREINGAAVTTKSAGTKDTGEVSALNRLTNSLEFASTGGHKIMDVLNATRETYDITDSPDSGSGLFEGSDPARFGLMEYTDGAKLMVHQNGCFDLAAGTSVTYDSLGTSDSLISVVLGDNEMIKSEHYHYTGGKWATETWEKTRSYTYNNGWQENIFYGQTYDYFLGKKFDATTAVSVSANLGLEASMSAGLSTEVKLAGEFKIGSGVSFSLVSEGSVGISGGENSLKGKEVLLQYEPPAKAKAAAQTIGFGIVGGAMGAIGATAIAGHAIAKDNHGNVKDAADTIRPVADIATIAGLAVGPAALIAYGAQKLISKLLTKAPVAVLPFIKVEKSKITLHAGLSKIELNSDGSIRINGRDIYLDALKSTNLTSKFGTNIDAGLGNLDMKSMVAVKLESKTRSVDIKGASGSIKGLKVDMG